MHTDKLLPTVILFLRSLHRCIEITVDIKYFVMTFELIFALAFVDKLAYRYYCEFQ